MDFELARESGGSTEWHRRDIEPFDTVNTAGGAQDIVAKNGTGSRNFSVSVDFGLDGGVLTFKLYDNCTGSIAASVFIAPVVPNQWSFAAMTFSDSDQATIYLNGASQSISHTVPIPSCPAGDIVIANGGNENFWFRGEIADVAIWKEELSSATVDSIYKRGMFKQKFQVRSCAAADCSDATFRGPDGTINSYYEADLDNFSDEQTVSITGSSPLRYHQYRAFFETLNSNFTSSLKFVELRTSE